MTKKEEQLQEEVVETPNEEAPVETKAEETVEETTEEVAEEPKEEEASTEEVPATEKEEPVEVAPVEELDVENEQLNIEIKQTKEELAVIKEVRDELVKLYGDYKSAEQLKQEAVKENEKLKGDVEALAGQLHNYKVAEEKLEAERTLQRLERLSAKFTALGQSKSVEYLSGKDSETLSEFEKIVDAALSKVGNTAEMPSVTANTQTEQLSQNTETNTKPVKQGEQLKSVPKEQLRGENFFENLCNELTSQQHSASNGKKIKLM